YQEQLKELDRTKRADIIKQMQERLYTDAPVIALYYPNDLEGYRKDRIKSITSVPEQDGILYGASSFWPFYSLEAVEPSSAAAEESGSNTGLIVGVVGVVVLAGLVAVFLMRRRKAAADDRE